MFSYQAVLGLFCIFVGIVTLFLPPRRLGARTAPRLPPQIQRIVPYLIALAMIGLGIALIVQGSR